MPGCIKFLIAPPPPPWGDDFKSIWEAFQEGGAEWKKNREKGRKKEEKMIKREENKNKSDNLEVWWDKK